MSKRSAKASARSAEREATAAMVPPSASCIPSANPVAMAPGPTTPQRITVCPWRGGGVAEGSRRHRDEALTPISSGRLLSLVTLSSGPAWDNASDRHSGSARVWPRQEDHDRSLHPATGAPLHLRAVDRGQPGPGPFRY